MSTRGKSYSMTTLCAVDSGMDLIAWSGWGGCFKGNCRSQAYGSVWIGVVLCVVPLRLTAPTHEAPVRAWRATPPPYEAESLKSLLKRIRTTAKWGEWCMRERKCNNATCCRLNEVQRFGLKIFYRHMCISIKKNEVSITWLNKESGNVIVLLCFPLKK